MEQRVQLRRRRQHVERHRDVRLIVQQTETFSRHQKKKKTASTMEIMSDRRSRHTTYQRAKRTVRADAVDNRLAFVVVRRRLQRFVQSVGRVCDLFHDVIFFAEFATYPAFVVSMLR